jgi:two-component system, LytTR family, response regulator
MTRVLIADDEAPARRKLERFLKERGAMEIVAEASNGIDAIDLIAITKPEVVFLDIHMPDLDGLAVAEALAETPSPPAIVFVTAHDQYALRAFDVSAVDYLLKPYDRAQFTRAVERAVARAGLPEVNADGILARLIREARNESGFPKRFLVPHQGRSFFVAVDDIVRVSSDANNVELHTSNGHFRLRTTMESLETRLDPAKFVRLHRCHIVSIDAIAAIEPSFRGDYVAILHNGERFPWSRRYATRRQDLLP